MTTNADEFSIAADYLEEGGGFPNAVKALRKAADNAKMRAESCFVGGPFDGKYHGYGWDGTFVLKVSRAQWAVYVVRQRHNYQGQKAYFVGVATSQAKGREMVRQERVKLGHVRQEIA